MIKTGFIERRFGNLFGCNRSRNYSKPYSEIPGPRGLFGLGNLYQYLPIIGHYSWLKLHKAGFDKYQKYGPIVRETIVPGQDIVWLYDPEDIFKVLNEREYPQRRSHLALEKYRKDRPHIYRTGGLLPTNGTDWWTLRSEFQKEISAPRVARDFLKAVDQVTHAFVNHLTTGRSFDMLPELSRLNLELTCAFTFGKLLNAFSVKERDKESRSSRLIRAAQTTNSSILPTDQGLQLWRYLKTPTYRQLEQAQEYMESVAIEFVDEVFDDIMQKQQQQHHHHHKTHDNNLSLSRDCLINSYIKNTKLQRSDVIGIANDLLLAGIDTTSYTSAFAIYYISKDPSIQERIYDEATFILPSKCSELMAATLNSSIPYTRAVLKEVYRMNPVSIGVGRILNTDMVLSGYRVPKGNCVVTQNMASCRLEKYFQNPLQFSPERWLHPQSKAAPHKSRDDVSPYLVLPFGHGMRACIARRLAEQNMIVLLLRLLRHFEIIWTGTDEPLDVKTLLINKPDAPVSIRLRRR